MDREQMPHESDGKLEPGSITTHSRVLKWLDNYWYHYKWHTIIGLFAAVVLIMGIVQMISRPKYDTMMVCANPYRMSDEEKAAFDGVLSKICPEDFDGNGKKNVNLVTYQIYSDAELQAEKEAAEVAGDEYYYNAQFLAEERKNFSSFTQTGEGAVCLISRHLYEQLISTDPIRLRPISDLYPDGNLPDGVTEEGYGITLGETDFYIYHAEVQVLSEDLIICLLKPTLVGGDKTGYAHAEAFFKALAEYRVG